MQRALQNTQTAQTMRKLTLLFLSLTLSLFSIAQAPQALNYQAVARNTAGSPLAMQAVVVRFTVIDGTVNGPTAYQETHTTTTNAYGLFTLAIGRGSTVSGTFAGINWGAGDKFLKVEFSTDGGANYNLQGTTQFLSVPYALYAQRTNLQAGNAINITGGNTINGAYTGGMGITVNGATIAHAMQAGVGINITGATISGNYQGGNGINITGNTISSSYVAGPGISITGNTISNTGTNQWLTHTNGIYYNAGKVGIGATPDATIPLTVYLPNTGVGNSIMHLRSNDVWHSALSIFNSANGFNNEYSFIVGGPINTSINNGSFGLFNHQSLSWSYNVDVASNYMAVGSTGLNSNVPKSRLHVFAGDVNIEQIGSGIILKSPNGNCWRVTVDNSGNLVRTAITCP
jgi:hypothetical protein